MSQRCSIVCSALVALALAGAAQAEPYVNASGGWSVEVPEGWLVDDVDPAFVEFRPPGARAGAILGVQTGSGPNERLEIVATLVVGGWQRAVSATGSQAEVTSREPVTLPSGEAAIVVSATVEGEPRGRARILVTRIAGQMVVLTAEGTREDWRRHGAGLDAAIDSFASLSP